MSDNNSHLTREQLAMLDWQQAFLDPRFKRIMFTILSTAGMFGSNFHSEGRIHAYGEGRRSLGLDILRTAEKYLGQEALLLILSEEMKTQKEAPSGKRKSTDRKYADDRRAELGGSDDVREPGTGLEYLDYGDGS